VHLPETLRQDLVAVASSLLLEPEDPVPEVAVEGLERLRGRVPRARALPRLAEEEQIDLDRSSEDEHVAGVRAVAIPLFCERPQSRDEGWEISCNQIEIVGLDCEVPVGEPVRPTLGTRPDEAKLADGRMRRERRADAPGHV
jgi:hypothetical protein